MCGRDGACKKISWDDRRDGKTGRLLLPLQPGEQAEQQHKIYSEN